MMRTRLSGVAFLVIAVLALGDGLGYYNLSATAFLSVILICVGAVIMARTIAKEADNS